MASPDVLSHLQSAHVFSDLDADDLNDLASSSEIVKFKLGETILRAGEPGQGFFVIVEGKARVVLDGEDGKPITLALLKPGQSFGERSLLFDEDVSATVRSAGKTTLVKLPKDRFLEVVGRRTQIRDAMLAAVQSQADFNLIKNHRFFSALDAKSVKKLTGAFTSIDAADGDTIFSVGDEDRALYIIKHGCVRLFVEEPVRRVVSIIRAGDAFGVTSVVDNVPQTITAVADGPATIIRISGEDVIGVCEGTADCMTALRESSDNRELQIRAFSDAEYTDDQQDLDGPRIFEDKFRPQGSFFSLPIAQCNDPRLSSTCCLQMIARYFKRDFDSSFALAHVEQMTEAPTLFNIGRDAEAAGMMTRLVHLPDEELDRIMLPFVIMRDQQPLVVFSVNAKSVVVCDPIHGRAVMPRETFLSIWDGDALSIQNVPDFGKIDANVFSLPKRFLPLLKPFYGVLARIGAITLLLQLFGLIPPFFSQILIDNVLVVGNKDLLLLLLIGMLFATFIGLIADSLRDFLTLHLSRRLSAIMFTRFFDHVLSLPMTTLRRWDTGALTARFEENEKILNMASNGALSVIVNSVAIIIYTPILFIMDQRLAIIALVFILGIVATIIYCAPKLRAFDQRAFDAGAEQESHLIEVVKGISTIKSMAQEEEFIERGRGFFARAMKIEQESERFDQKMEFVTDLLQQGSAVIVLGIGALFVLDGSMSPGQLIAFTAIVASVMGPAEALANFYDEFLEFRVALERLNDVLAEPKETSVQVTSACPRLKGRIRFDNVSFSYGDPEHGKILDNIDLDIKAGQKVAFIGRSGSGKSTLVNLVNRMLKPTSGRITIDGIDIDTLDLRSLREQIGVVEQSPFVFSGTVRDNISKSNPNMGLNDVVAAATKAGAHDFISAFPTGYDTRIGEGGRSLSGGQSQRMIIARALAAEPAILILDEATAALDSESERVIQQRLDEAMEGRTTLAVAHRLSTIRNADLIVVLNDGKIAESGSHDELIEQQGVYYHMVNQTVH